MELKLEKNEVQYVLQVLSTRPYAEVAQLITKIAKQLEELETKEKK